MTALRRWLDRKKDGRWAWWEALVLIAGPPALGWYALRAYPLLDGSDPLYVWAFWGGTAAGLILALTRGRLFGFHRVSGAFKLLGVPVLAAWIGLCVLCLALFVNGALDPAAMQEEPWLVTEAWDVPPVQDGDTLYWLEASSPDRGLSMDLELERAAWHRVEEGDTVWFRVRPGLLGSPWYEWYRVMVGRPESEAG